MSDLLAEIEDHFGDPPRRIGLFERFGLRERPPYWLAADDPLRETYRWQDLLLKEGHVVWGAIVQANGLLFRDGMGDHPAVAVYSTDPAFRVVDRLQTVAGRLYALKGTVPDDPDLRRIAQGITDEHDRSLQLPVPRKLTGNRAAFTTTLMVHRKHLPDGRLELTTFPLLIHPNTPATLILPSRYWPDSYLGLWTGDDEDEDEDDEEG